MKCPIDNADLQMTDRQGVEIDYCPKCRGVWLDRGELDKIIERSEQPSPSKEFDSPRHEYEKKHDHQNDHYGKHGRRKGLLGELFDF